MDGLEKGSDVEFFYTFKKPTSFFGREVVQGGSPALETQFKIIAPKRLKFDVKAYNSSVAAIDTIMGEKAITECRFKEIPGAEDEKYANYYANLTRVEFKLSYNYSVNKDVRLYSWNQLAKRVYGIYTDYSDREVKAVAEIVTKNGWDKIDDETAKITAVENYIKKKYLL